jgi:hypothetical protein
MKQLLAALTVSVCLIISCGLIDAKLPQATEPLVDLPVMQNDLTSHGVGTPNPKPR